MADFEWYRSFVAIYQTGTVSAAARRRSLTQPAISQHLAALESRFDGPLFKRTPRRMVPTPTGQELYSRIIDAVERLEHVDGTRRSPAPNQLVTLRLGAPREYFHVRGLAAFGAAREAGYRVALSFGETPDLIGRLLADELDAVIATQRIDAKQLAYAALMDEEFALVAARGAKVPRRRAGLEAWLGAQPWISYGSELPLIRRYWQVAFGKRPDIVPQLVLPDLRAILHAVELGLGVSVLPTYLSRPAVERKTVRVIAATHQRVGNRLFVAYPAHRRAHGDIEWLKRALTDGATGRR